MIEDNAALLYVNYFGLMGNNISVLQNKYPNLIIDNAQAFYAKPLDTIPTFYSPRKFFGLPDGGFVYTDKRLKVELELDKSFDRLSHLIARLEDGAEEGYKLFQQNENRLSDLPLMWMSKLTKKLLKNIDFKVVQKKRNENFKILHQVLKVENEFSPIIEKANINGPMVYPFLRNGNSKLRGQLNAKKYFVARYWPNVNEWLSGEVCFETSLLYNLIPLPVDQRYDKNEVKKIYELIK